MVRDNNRTAAAHDKVIVIGNIIKVTDVYLIDHFVTLGHHNIQTPLAV
ncbi:hypothetical protein GTH10_05785 [Burkholderia thailandensis]|nr:hypothetical protein [Burkholderia thailandensis]NOK46897.1 hypothetical protein [Burkholderia thailandensis]